MTGQPPLLVSDGEFCIFCLARMRADILHVNRPSTSSEALSHGRRSRLMTWALLPHLCAAKSPSQTRNNEVLHLLNEKRSKRARDDDGKRMSRSSSASRTSEVQTGLEQRHIGNTTSSNRLHSPLSRLDRQILILSVSLRFAHSPERTLASAASQSFRDLSSTPPPSTNSLLLQLTLERPLILPIRAPTRQRR